MIPWSAEAVAIEGHRGSGTHARQRPLFSLLLFEGSTGC